MPVWLVVMIAFGVSMLAAIPMYFAMKKGERRAKARMTELAAGRMPVLQVGARNFGVRAPGAATKARGAGGLMLFDDELVFVPAASADDVRVPRAAIVGVARADGMLGKRGARKLLQIAWKQDGAIAAAAWQVPELEPWIDALGGERTA